MKSILRTWSVGIFLTVRSLTRGNKSTTIMTIFMMAMIFVNLIFLTSIINGLNATAYRQIIEVVTGEVLVEAPAGQTVISQAQDVHDQLLQVENVEQVSTRINFSAELEQNGEQGSYRGIAIDPDEEKQVTTVADHMIAGRFLQPDDTNAIVMGIQIAGAENIELEAYSLKDVQVGEMVTLKLTNGFSKEYEVVGIFDTDFVQSDNRFFVSQHEYQSLAPEFTDKASEFAVKLRPDADLDQVVGDMNRLGIDFSVRTWKDTAGIVESFTSSFDIVNFIVSMVAIIVAGITIFIVMYVDVVNRRKQIGILRAIGIAEQSIAISYLLRALLYAAAGVIVGMLLFKFIIMPMFVRTPLQLPVGNVSLVIDNTLMYVRACALLLVSFLGAYIPIQRALRMHIIDAIWGE